MPTPPRHLSHTPVLFWWRSHPMLKPPQHSNLPLMTVLLISAQSRCQVRDSWRPENAGLLTNRSIKVNGLGVEFGEQLFDPGADVVADCTDNLDGLAGGVGELPVLVALAGKDRAGVTTAHGDDDIAFLGGGVVELLGVFGSDVDADLPHRLDRNGVDLVGGLGAGGADLNAGAGEVTQPSGSHLRAASVVYADEQDAGTGHRSASFSCSGWGTTTTSAVRAASGYHQAIAPTASRPPSSHSCPPLRWVWDQATAGSPNIKSASTAPAIAPAICAPAYPARSAAVRPVRA